MCDMGCGPGHVTHYLQSLGVSVFGLDISPLTVEMAKRLNPQARFEVGDILSLGLRDGSLIGIVAFYAIVNIPTESLSIVFREMFRVLEVGGLLLLAFHIGDEVVHFDELWECPVSLDFFYFEVAEIRSLLEGAGFTISTITEREPYAPEVEHQSHRAYIFAKKSGS